MAEKGATRAEPRGFWSGTITFGLVSVPVDLYPAVRSRRIPLRMLSPDGHPLQRRYYCSADGEPLDGEDIVRGYEWEDGGFTVVSDEELDALAPRKSRDIDLRRFVDRAEIPPRLFERPYVLAPAGESTRAYHLLAETMERTRRAGVATFVMRGKEYLAAIFAEGGLLRAATLRFDDEVRSPEAIGLPEARQAPAAIRREMEKALGKLVKKSLDESKLHNEDATQLLELAEAKRAKGRDVVEVPEAPAEVEAESAEIIDIMSILRRRVGAGRSPSAAKPQDTLAGQSKKELYEQAKSLDVPGRSQMSKDELIDAIRAAR
jgi:DNA end-binding protein Ku